MVASVDDNSKPAQQWCWHEAVSAAVLMVLASVRVLVTFDNRPTWPMEAVADASEAVRIGAVGTAVVDTLFVGVLASVLIGRWRRGCSVRGPMVAAWLIGVAVVIYHGWADAANWRIGWAWAGALAAGLAAMYLAERPGVAKLILASAAALALPLGIAAVHQVTIQHDRDVAHYQKHRTAIIEQHGWEADSPQLHKFETRLYQREASGRLGLANVFGSVMAGLTLVAGGLAAGLWRGGTKRTTVAVGAAVAAVGAAGWVCSFSRGAIAAGLASAVGLGAAVWGYRLWRNRRGGGVAAGRWYWRVVVMAMVAMGMAAVVGRYAAWGVPTSARGERSLLFRYMYWDGAAAMLAERPMTGVGPGRFQQTYATHKRVYEAAGSPGSKAVGPEDVIDPHNVFVAYLSTLGLVGGVAWGTLVVLWLVGAADGAAERLSGEPAGAGAKMLTEQGMRRWSFVIVLGWFVIAMAFQAEMMLVDYGGFVFLSEYGGMLAAGAAVAAVFVDRLFRSSVDDRWVTMGALAAAAAVLLHNQIEMAITHVMAGPILMVIIGAAAARPGGECTARRRAGAIRTMLTAAAVVAVVAAGTVSVMGTVRLAMQQRAFDSCRQAFGQKQWAVLPARLDALGLRARQPYDGRLYVEAVSMRWWLMQRAGGPVDPQAVKRWFDEVATTAKAHHDGRVWRALAEMTGQWEKQSGTDGRQTTGLLERWLRGRPHDWQAYLRAADLAWELGRKQRAGQWYGRALALERMCYLDPNSMMRERERRRARARQNASPPSRMQPFGG